MECLKKDVQKEKEKLNLNSNKKTTSNDDAAERVSDTTKIEQNSNKNIVIKNKNCGGSLENCEGDINTESLSDAWTPKAQTNHKLSDAMLNILNADIVKTKGVRLKGDCLSSNSTKVLKVQPMESLFDLKIDDDENDSKSNSCNKTNYNVTIVFVSEKLNLTCNETVTKPKCLNISDPCANGACAKDVLKKLFIREMLETKQLKHKLITLYLERKRLKMRKEEKSQLLEQSRINKPPLFNHSDFDK